MAKMIKLEKSIKAFAAIASACWSINGLGCHRDWRRGLLTSHLLPPSLDIIERGPTGTTRDIRISQYHVEIPPRLPAYNRKQLLSKICKGNKTWRVNKKKKPPNHSSGIKRTQLRAGWTGSAPVTDLRHTSAQRLRLSAPCENLWVPSSLLMLRQLHDSLNSSERHATLLPQIKVHSEEYVGIYSRTFLLSRGWEEREGGYPSKRWFNPARRHAFFLDILWEFLKSFSEFH